MNVRLFLLVASLFAAVPCAAVPGSAKPTSAPTPDPTPAGLSPAWGSVPAILSAHERAVGRLPPGTADTSTERWIFTDAGLVGSETLTRNGTDYRSTIVAGPFVEDYGRLGDVRWHRDDNGVTTSLTANDYRSFTMLRVLEDAADPKNDVTLIGEAAGSNPADVIEVHRPGYKHPEWIFYDKATSLIDRVESIEGGERIVSTYDDYRETHGLTEPWHVHDAYKDHALDDDWKRSSLQVGAPVDGREFARLRSSRAVIETTEPIQIPARFVDGTIVVRLTVQGRGLDFSLSTGTPHSIIDRDVAADLNLPAFGQNVKGSDGSAISYKTVLAGADLGPIHLSSVVLRVYPYHYHPAEGTKVVGTLGYDALAGVVTKIDYVNGTLTLLPPTQFDNPALNGRRAVVPLDVVDDVPYFSGTIGSARATHLLLDNDEDLSIIFGSFADQHPDDLKDVKNRQHATYIAPFADSRDFGVSIDIWRAAPSHLSFGPVDFQSAHLLSTNYPYELHGQAVDGIVGADVLGFYDVFADFPHDRLILVPNANFFKAFHVEKQ